MSTPAEAAAQQIQGQAELGSAATSPGAPDAVVGQQLAAAGAGATDIDVAALLAQLNALQSTVAGMQAAQAAAGASDQPGIVQRAEDLLADLTHRNGALGARSALGPAVEKAAALVESAKSAAESGDTSEFLTLAGALGKHLARVSPAAASADISYARQLVDEDIPEAAAAVKPAAAPAATAAPAQAPAAAAPARGPVTHTF